MNAAASSLLFRSELGITGFLLKSCSHQPLVFVLTLDKQEKRYKKPYFYFVYTDTHLHIFNQNMKSE